MEVFLSLSFRVEFELFRDIIFEKLFLAIFDDNFDNEFGSGIFS